ncbi:MAG: hypothetical protein KDF59_11520 [Nitrosomonas sp.]|nr:hypothetical protein [Nitrosomonas sp.]
MANTNNTVKVLSFSPSADAELNRWVLFYYGISFNEKRHTLPFYFILNKLQGGNSLVLCRDGQTKLKSVREVINHFDAQVTSDKKLIPDAHINEMEYSWHRYNSDLGQAAVEWAYTNLLPHKDIMIRPLTLGSPWIERQFVKYCYNIPKKMVWNSQQLSKPVADNALVLIKDIFYEVDQLLSDGRKYLYGDKLTLADLTFAVSGAPLVLPANYGGDQFEQGPIPTFEEFPEELQETISTMRQTDAGRYILRLYSEDRYRTIEHNHS